MNALAAFALSLAGFAALALSLERHHADIHGRGSMPARGAVARLRLAGAVALALAWALHVAAQGGPLGTVAWVGTLTASAIAVALGLSYVPRAVQRLLPGMALVGLAGAGAGWLLAG
ncbi:DUF3325 domain-containing protein [Cupriavidus taiwanensis]|uniref:Iron uptake protein n=1 Tax=Cupriavidus taiwanensis TaxID=164546 RepID=A0A7Z7NPL6_9BURK|nr:DUF3325 domain-containing protein [Cupriavidus taiwanensis]SOZ09396.1 conserved hypothetical protein; putative membrane protein [Cupriavidus taiwanensis]SOZ11520.1 conserved hypothetical protein; putative membrane protein [Cupriavidus taiwanensis]SOZ42875.1 conserved hypothetical protein; putative membrane protein [Cupriavidus taiwanensis]SPC22122.1 conserved hypothetical protein; putative membrane protein [Cupriavidus taiwanensis]SPD53625.1 conserved membrane protein of unknown function [C